MKLRGSTYNISVKLTEEESLLVHGYTGAVKKVTAGTLGYIRSLDNSKIRESAAYSVPSDIQMANLRRDGFITRMSPEKEEAFITEMNKKMHNRQLNAKPEYMIIPAYSCNFDCSYCFEKDMRLCKEDEFAKMVISLEMCDRICHTFGEIENKLPPEKADRDNRIQITFYGGEPLQRTTKEAVAYLLEKLKVKNLYNFSAITNGYDLEYFKELLSPELISELQITVDGIPAIHNTRRFLKNSRGETFSKIADNISMALDRGVRVNIRISTDRDTISGLEELNNEIDRRGWKTYKNFRAYLAPVFSLKEEPGYEKCMNYGEILNKLRKFLPAHPGETMFKIPVSPESYFNPMKEYIKNEKSLTPFFRSAVCNAMGTLLIFDLYGDVYPCYEMVGKNDSVIGNICKGDILEFDEQVCKKWRGRLSTSNPACSKCKYTMFCGGGCASRAEKRNGTIYTSYCDGFPAFFQAKVRELYLEDEKL